MGIPLAFAIHLWGMGRMKRGEKYGMLANAVALAIAILGAKAATVGFWCGN